MRLFSLIADPMKNLLGYSSSVPSLIKVLWGAAVLSKLGEHRDSVKVAWSTMVYALKVSGSELRYDELRRHVLGATTSSVVVSILKVIAVN